MRLYTVMCYTDTYGFGFEWLVCMSDNGPDTQRPFTSSSKIEARARLKQLQKLYPNHQYRIAEVIFNG